MKYIIIRGPNNIRKKIKNKKKQQQKQEAHWPHRSPEKTKFKSINRDDYIIILIKRRKKTHDYLYKN